MAASIHLAESGRVPDAVIRAAVRQRVRMRLRRERRGTVAQRSERQRELLARRALAPVTTHTVEANRQHYEVPTGFFQLMLGPRLKYSACLWEPGTDDLAAAEEAMLALTAERAGVGDGQRVLDLGSGWGSFTLWAAAAYPRSSFLAVSNSSTQQAHVTDRAAELGLTNVTALACDVAAFAPDARFDRIVSVEMFEHVANHRALLARMASWLEPGGRAFVHVFSHRDTSWSYDPTDDRDWMARHFFSGGVLPSDDLLLHEQRDMVVLDHWRLDGTHYSRTLEAWLDRLDARRDEARAVLSAVPSADGAGPAPDTGDADVRLQRWRIFLLACAEMLAYRRGTEFGISHYLFEPRP